MIKLIKKTGRDSRRPRRQAQNIRLWKRNDKIREGTGINFPLGLIFVSRFDYRAVFPIIAGWNQIKNIVGTGGISERKNVLRQDKTFFNDLKPLIGSFAIWINERAGNSSIFFSLISSMAIIGRVGDSCFLISLEESGNFAGSCSFFNCSCPPRKKEKSIVTTITIIIKIIMAKYNGLIPSKTKSNISC